MVLLIVEVVWQTVSQVLLNAAIVNGTTQERQIWQRNRKLIASLSLLYDELPKSAVRLSTTFGDPNTDKSCTTSSRGSL